MYAVIVGGTWFVGRHTVAAFLEEGYHVTIVTRGESPNPFAEEPKVRHVQGDRNERAVLERTREEAVPDVVVDCIALAPQQVATALDVFRDVDAYVFVSSSGAYGRDDLPRREGETPLEDFGPEHAVDDPRTLLDGEPDWAAYGPRKAECERVCVAATEDGANAVVVRPTDVFGPHDYTGRFAYWIDRVASHDRVLVPGDGTHLAHQVYVEDLARAIRTVAERGAAGEAYNVGARQLLPVDHRLELVAAALDTDGRIVHASERDLAGHGLSPTDFPLVGRQQSILDTGKLAALGWESTPHDEAIARTVAAHLDSERDGRPAGPEGALTRAVIEDLEPLDGAG